MEIKKIGIIDYNCGNIGSLKNYLNLYELNIEFTRDFEILSSCSHIILPGVGSFKFAMDQLNELNLISNIYDLILKQKKPTLGICLGMQILFDKGYENGESDGLGILKGSVLKIPKDKNFNIPNIGWWGLKGKFNKISNKLSEDDSFYFVHSYYCDTDQDYNNLYINNPDFKILASILYKNIMAVQFHPEKSQLSGKKIFDFFLSNY